ncbi:hypothetical protein VP1G_09999 [Cytospora mali]|uniref:Uncharacterized protein n=1 Tax=Cytospora mali TaxID=578113 RepID=A0A194VFT3_CYTMA|nr:hypothetical protein VP1G_09999 [Valsa mali var. pyri (nom. inval.)]
MPREELLNRSPIIDLISDNESDPTPLQVVDSTLLDDLNSFSDILSESKMELDAQTPSITSGCGQKESSVVNMNKEPDSDDSSSDNAMTLSSILARGRKHKHGSNNTGIAKPKPDTSSLLQAQEGLRSFLGNKSSGPKTNFWTIHTPVSSQPVLPQTQPKLKHKKKDEERKKTNHPIKQANPCILNIDIEEISSHKDRRRRGNKTPDQHGKLNGHRHVRSLPEEALSRKGHATKTTDPTRLFNTNVNAGDQHTRKRPRLDGLGGATTNGVPQTSPNHYTNQKPPETDRTVKDRCPETITAIDVGKDDSTADSLAGRPREGEILEMAGETARLDRTNLSNKTSRGTLPSSAFGDLTSKTSFSARRRRTGDTVSVSQPNVTHGKPRPSSPVPGSASVGRRKRPGEDTQPLPSSSRQRPSRLNSGPAKGTQLRRVSVEPIEGQWDGIKRVHERSLAEDAKRNLSQSTQPNKTAGQEQQRKEEIQASNHHVPAQQLPDDLFDSDTSLDVSSTTNGVQPALQGYDKSQAGTHEHTDVGSSKVQNLSGAHVRQPEPLPQPKPQSKPSTIKLSTNPAAPEPSQSYASRKETFQDAAASFNLLKSQYEKKRNSIILDSVPADFGIPSRASRTQAVHKASYLGRKPRRSAREAENKRMRYRERAIENKRKKLEEEYADEPEPYRETLVNEKLDEYRQKFVENDRKRKAQAESYLTVDFLEDGVGADDDADNNNPADGGRHHAAPAAQPNGAIPASQAMGPNEMMVLYAVYISEPFEDGQNYEDHMQRAAEAFLKKDEANVFAQKLLTGTCSSSSSSRQPVQNPTSVQYDHDVNGLLFGRKRLPDGKIVCCMVEKEKQVFGLWDMSNKWVREEAKDLYRPRYDIFYTNVIPKVFLDKEEEYKKKRKEQKAKESVEKEADARKKSEEGKVQGMEKGREESPWIWNLGDEDEDSNRLSSSTPTPQPEASQGADQEADDENSSQASDHDEDEDEDDDDTASVASSATLKPTHPGGALGKLSWADVEYYTIHAASYTDLRLANEEALKVALLIWKPRTSRLNAWTRYDYEVVPSIEEARNDMDLDADRVEIEFEVPEVGGPVDHRPWLFVHSQVYVVESKLEGPRDIACDFVVVDGEDE